MYFCMFFRPQIKIFIEGLFSFNQDISAFKEHLRDFLVQIRVSTCIKTSTSFESACIIVIWTVWQNDNLYVNALLFDWIVL